MTATVFYARWPARLRALAHYIHMVFIALDQLVTALAGGWPDETVSSYLHRLDREGKLAGRLFRPAVDWVWRMVFRQDDHCRQAYLSEVDRYQLPPEMRRPWQAP